MDLERVFTHGAFFIQYLQKRFWSNRTFFIWVSYIGDPKFAFLFHFPVLFAISRKTGLQWLVAACISECVNLVLKWVLQEDRPYWWVGENANQVGNLTLKQFPITCETGPGSPSGHVMVATTVLYVLVYAVVKKRSLIIWILGWIALLTLVVLVATSRMFLAAHFPHQCLLGFTIGLALGSIISKVKLSSLNSHNLLKAGVVCCLATLGTYHAQMSLGHDPNMSLKKALKWCVKRSYVHLDNTPLFASMRYTGALLGTGLAVRNISWDRYISSNNLVTAGASVVCGVAVCACVLYCPMPTTAATASYVFSCCMYIALFIVLVRMIPEALMWLFGTQYKKKD